MVAARTVVDYSGARPAPAELRAAGKTGVMRYLAPPPNSKVLTAGELAGLRAAKLDVGLVWETTAGRAGEGFDAGAADRTAAEKMADALGFPLCAIYMAIDADLGVATVAPYFRGVSSMAKRWVGGYGGAFVLDGLAALGLVHFRWFAAAWGHGAATFGGHLAQHDGSLTVDGCDDDDALVPDWGQWHAIPPPPAPPASPTPRPQRRLTGMIYVHPALGWVYFHDGAVWQELTPAEGMLYAAQGVPVVHPDTARWTKIGQQLGPAIPLAEHAKP